MPKIFTQSGREKLRRQLLRNGLALFCENGYMETSVDDIVRSAGVSRGLFYTMFPSKEEFALQALQDRQEIVYEMVTYFMAQTNLPVEQRIWNIIEACIRNEKKMFSFLKLKDTYRIAAHVPQERMDVYMEVQEEFFAKIVRLMGKDPARCDPKVVANLATVFFQGISTIKGRPFLHQDVIDETVECFARAFWNYIVTH